MTDELNRPSSRRSAFNGVCVLASAVYPAGQALARDILASGGNGVLYPSARYEGGKCLVALRPNLVQNIREGETWVFRWAGSAEVEILRVEST